MSQPRRPLVSLSFDAILGVLMALGGIPAVVLSRRAYEVGAAGSALGLDVAMAGFAGRPLLAMIFILLVVVGAVRCFWMWRKSGRTEAFARLGILVAGVAVGSIQFAYQRDLNSIWREGFCDWARQSIDVEALRAWRDERLRGPVSHDFIDLSQWPPFVAKVSPQYVTVYDGEARLVWGGGFGHWGVAVGRPDREEHWGRGETRTVISGDFYVWWEY